MAQKTRAQLVALLNSNVKTGGNRTTAQDIRDFENAIIESLLNIIDDADTPGGFQTYPGGGVNPVTVQDTLSDTDIGTGFSTYTLPSNAIAGTVKVYLNGQRCGIGPGYIVESIVTSLSVDVVFFDADYTGQNIIIDYNE